MRIDEFIEYFLDIPVSINNLYGDSFFPTQIENTFSKLDELQKDSHKGIVSIITKTEITDQIASRLSQYTSCLNLIILVSISELPFEIEKIKGFRYNTLKLCNEYNIPCLAYVRPFIPNENTSPEAIDTIFRNIKNAGTNVVVVSGLRGGDDILKNLDIKPEEFDKWSMRVKIIPAEVRKALEECREKYDMTTFERTSCGVTYVLGKVHSYNPYYASPQLARCGRCPLKVSCFDKQFKFVPSEKDLELVRLLGYNADIVNNGRFELCKTDPAKRTECVSCCTSCFRLERTAIEVQHFDDQKICLGDIGLLRLLTKKLVFCKGVIDSGDSTIAHPKNPFLADSNLYILNSWSSFSRNTGNCYRCSYCIVPTFKNLNQEYGASPKKVGEILIRKLQEKGVIFDE